jgi:nicotinamidase-related amidase
MPPIPQTLLHLAGAPLHPSPLAASALVLIDHQMEYVTGGLKLAGIAAAVAEMGALLALARAGGVPVFHVVHHGRPGAGLFDPDGAQVAIIAAVEPRAGEAVVVKSLPNAFAGTDLDRLIRATGRTELIVAGFATHMCVSATVRAALDLGYRTTLVAAATATRDLPDPLGGVVAADTLQRAELAALADRFAVVVADCASLPL